MDTTLLICLCFLTLLSLLCGCIHTIHLISLWNHQTVQYIKQRKPKLLILYVILSILILLMILPNIFISIYVYNSHPGSRNEEYYFVFDLIYGSVFCAFIIIIAIRVWLLFYEHQFAIATVDRNWRHIITPSDTNFFLNHKHTFGNDTFLMKIVFAIYSILIMLILSLMYCLSSTTTYAYHEYLFFTLRLCISIPVSIFVFYFIDAKIKNNDPFEMRKEMQYLSYLLCYVLLMSGIALCTLFLSPSLYILEYIVYFGDILFIFMSSYLQTGWVLRRAQTSLNKLEIQRRSYKAMKANKSGNSKTAPKLSMVQLLRNKTSFEAFMRHCVSELSVESVLFLVEVAQYKASLSSYNAPDRMSQFVSIGVQHANLRQMLIESREQRHTPLCDGGNAEYSLVFQRSTSFEIRIPKQRPRMDSNLRLFQGSILHRDWMPIAAHLRPFHISLSESVVPVQAVDASKTMRDLKTTLPGPHRISRKISIPQSPIELTVEASSIKSMQSIETPFSLTSTPKTCSVSSEWIRDFAVFLYDKYIKTNSDLSVNISHQTRHFLTVLFAKSEEELFEYILKHSGGYLDQDQECPAGINQQLLINTYLYHVFDKAFDDVWRLTRENSFLRFTFTDSYKQLSDNNLT